MEVQEEAPVLGTRVQVAMVEVAGCLPEPVARFMYPMLVLVLN